MRKSNLSKAFRNISIGLLLLGIALYWTYLDFYLLSFSLDRAMILDDALTLGWNNTLTNWYQASLISEKNFIANSKLCQLVTAIPTLGKILFTIITIFLLWISINILYYNAKHINIIKKQRLYQR